MASRHAIDGLDDVWLFTTQEAGHGGQVSLLYEIEVARLSRVHFSIDFAGSVNFAVEALGGRRTRAAATSAGGPAAPAELFCVSVVAEPFARTAVGRLVLVDPTKPATLANSYAWALEPPDWQVLVARQKRSLAALGVLTRDATREATAADQQVALPRQCPGLAAAEEEAAAEAAAEAVAGGLTVASGASWSGAVPRRHFIDLEFPPSLASLYGRAAAAEYTEAVAAADHYSAAPVVPSGAFSVPLPSTVVPPPLALPQRPPQPPPRLPPLSFCRPEDLVASETTPRSHAVVGAHCGDGDPGSGPDDDGPLEASRPFGAVSLFPRRGKLRARHVRQGLLADCWFVSALSALAECPRFVRRLFPHHATTARRGPSTAGAAGTEEAGESSGKYVVRLCKGGQWASVVVDDWLPCWPHAGAPAYATAIVTPRASPGGGSSGSDGEEDGRSDGLPAGGGQHLPELSLWAPLLEKAYAKLHGSYDAVRFGWSHEAMLDLTGCPFAVARFEDPSVLARFASGDLWKEVLSWSEAGHLLTAATPGEDLVSEAYRSSDDVLGDAEERDEEDSDGESGARSNGDEHGHSHGTRGRARRLSRIAGLGLQLGHAYAVLGVAEVALTGADADDWRAHRGATSAQRAATVVTAAAPSDLEEQGGVGAAGEAAPTVLRLVRLRNPWGGGATSRAGSAHSRSGGDGGVGGTRGASPHSWCGAWGPGSPEWARYPLAAKAIAAQQRQRAAAAAARGLEPEYGGERSEIGGDGHDGGNDDDNDGAFWMLWEDLFLHFFSINCSMVGTPWTEQRRKICFTYAPGAGASAGSKGNSGGQSKGKDRDQRGGLGSGNGGGAGGVNGGDGGKGEPGVTVPMYELVVSEPLRLVVSVHQEDERVGGARPYLDFGVAILQRTALPGGDSSATPATCDSGRGAAPTASSTDSTDGARPSDAFTTRASSGSSCGGFRLVAASGNSAERQLQCEVAVLPPGRYLVVPTSTGCRFAKGLSGLNAASSAAAATATATDAALASEPIDGQARGQGKAVGVSLFKPDVGGSVHDRDEGRGKGEGSDEKLEFSDEVLRALGEMFRRLDADMDGVLSKRELGAYLELTEGLAAHGGDLADPVFRWLLGTFGRATGTPPGNGAAAAATTTAGAATTDAPGEGPGERLVEGSGGASGEAPGGAARGRAVGEEGLDEAGFRRCYRYLFASSGGDGEAVWRDLRAMGYRVIGGHLELLYARSAILAFHATPASAPADAALSAAVPSAVPTDAAAALADGSGDGKFSLTPRPFDAAAMRAAMELPITSPPPEEPSPLSPPPSSPSTQPAHAPRGCRDVRPLEGGRVLLFTRRSGYSGVSFAVENRTHLFPSHHRRHRSNSSSSSNSMRPHAAAAAEVAPATPTAATAEEEKTSEAFRGRALAFTLDCAGSTNVLSHRGSLRFTATVAPGEVAVLHHLMPSETLEPWSWTTRYRLRFI